MTPTPRIPRHHIRRRVAALLVGVAALGAGWYFLAPAALGGGTSYVVTDGVSMQPRIHTGDLAVVRPAGAYHVGDIVAYRSPSLHVTVLHRIVAITPAGRYVLRGDNNSWLDPGRISAAQIDGRLWVLAPGLGGRLQQLRSPATTAALAGLAVVLLLGGAGARAGVRRRRRRPQPKWKSVAPRREARVQPSYGSLAAAVVALAACAGLTAVAWTAPTSRSTPTPVSYRQSGTFTYSGSTIAGAVYSTGRATTGQPIFSRLVGPVQVQFAYALRAGLAGRVRGTATLNAVLAAQSGWSRTITLAGPMPFAGRRVAVAGILHLRRLQRLLERVATATQVPGQSFTLTLVPAVHAAGALAGRPFRADYGPQLPFTLTPLELSPALDDQAGARAPAHAGTAPVFHPEQTATFTAMRTAPVALGPARLRISDRAARVVFPIGLAAALAAVVLTARRLQRTRLADEPTRIQARYGASIVAAVNSTLAHERDIVEVESIEALARLGERYDSLMIHEHTDAWHAYLVADGGTVYAYFVRTPDAEAGVRERRPAELHPGVSSTRAA